MMNEFNPDGKDIRFIDSHYRDLFRIPDGGTIQVHYSDDSVVIKPCKFIDEYHTQIGNNCFPYRHAFRPSLLGMAVRYNSSLRSLQASASIALHAFSFHWDVLH